METATIALIALATLAAITLIGIFRTKLPGFGTYSTSTLVLVLVLFISSFFLILGKIDSSLFGNIVFAIAGYAGGLLTPRKREGQEKKG